MKGQTMKGQAVMDMCFECSAGLFAVRSSQGQTVLQTRGHHLVSNPRLGRISSTERCRRRMWMKDRVNSRSHAMGGTCPPWQRFLCVLKTVLKEGLDADGLGMSGYSA